MLTGGYFDRNDRTEVYARFANVTDGLSNTVMAGESINEWFNFGWWYWNNVTLGISAFPMNICRELKSGYVGSSLNHGYNSWHNGGANFGFGDGSVKFLSQNIDMKVYYTIATIDGGEIVSEF